MSKFFTSEEAKEIGEPLGLLNEWANMMQALWTESIDFYHHSGHLELTPKQGENEILIGEDYKICAHIVNSRYVDVELLKGKTVLLNVRHFGDEAAICMVVFCVLRTEYSLSNSKTV